MDTHRVYFTDGSHADFRAHEVSTDSKGWVVMKARLIQEDGERTYEVAWLNPESVKYIIDVKFEEAMARG